MDPKKMQKLAQVRSGYNQIIGLLPGLKMAFKRFLFPFYPFFIYFIVTVFFALFKDFSSSVIIQNTMIKDNNQVGFLYNILMTIGLTIYYLVWYIRKFHLNKTEKEEYGYKKINKKEILNIAILFLFFNLFTDSLFAVFSKFFTITQSEATQSYYNWPSYVLLIFVCLLNPFCEELMARGVCFNIARALDTPFWYANLIQAVLFSVIHESLYQKCYAFVFSLILGYIYNEYGSLLLTYILHALFNIWGLYISEYTCTLPFWLSLLIGLLALTILGYYATVIIAKTINNYSLRSKKRKIVKEMVNTKLNI